MQSSEKRTTQHQTPVAPRPELRDRTQRVCLALMQSEVDLAFSLLHLAEAEIRGGNDAHGRELLARACAMHKVALNYLDELPPGEEKNEFLIAVRKLFEAIRTAERLRRAQGEQQEKSD